MHRMSDVISTFQLLLGSKRKIMRNFGISTFAGAHHLCDFWATVCLCLSRLSVCLSVCPVCNVRALWPNGWTDQDETWHAGRLSPRPHCVRWGPGSPPKRGTAPQFSAHICCGQIAAWIKMSLAMELGLDPWRLCVRWGPRLPSPKGGRSPPKFRPMFIVAKRLDG